MSTRYYPTIDFSTFPESDGEPMAENLENQTQMIDLMYAFRRLFAERGVTQVTVGGNQFLYYNPSNGHEHCSPDVYVALDVAPGGRRTWKTWVEGKCPDIVFEITSPSTMRVDLEEKPGLYARLGAREYYIYDPQQELEPPLRGFLLAGGRATPLQLGVGGRNITCSLLGVEMRIVGQYLRLINPRTGQPFPTVDETALSLDATEIALSETREALSETTEALNETTEALNKTTAALTAAAERRQTAEKRAAREAQARYDAESRAAQAEARLQEALARLARLESPQDPRT